MEKEALKRRNKEIFRAVYNLLDEFTDKPPHTYEEWMWFEKELSAVGQRFDNEDFPSELLAAVHQEVSRIHGDYLTMQNAAEDQADNA